MYKINNINSVKATFSNNKIVNAIFNLNISKDNALSDLLFFGNIERNSYFSTNYRNNKNCLSSSELSHLIRNMYAADNCFYKSAIYDSSKTNRTYTTYDFLNITNHKMSVDHAMNKVVQVDNVFYGLEPKTKFGRYNISCDIYSYISSSTGYVFPPNTLISTAIYDLSAISAAIKKDDIDLLQKTAVSANLSNIQYNMAYEIPGNIYNDYESGNIAANTFKCKNAFDSIYNMDHDNSTVLKNARDYIKIDNCNKQVYMTYKDNICYADNAADGTVLTSGGYNNIKCEHVEIIGALNRYANLNGHKTNMYSIALYTNIFDCMNSTNEQAQTIKDNIKYEILHTVRNIVNKLQPINTLMLSVFINEFK